MTNQILLFFNIGAPEMMLIVLVIIMFFGSKKIPELARGLGKGMREFKNATSDIQREIKESTQEIKDSTDIKKQVGELMKDEKTDEKKDPPQQSKTISRSSSADNQDQSN